VRSRFARESQQRGARCSAARRSQTASVTNHRSVFRGRTIDNGSVQSPEQRGEGTIAAMMQPIRGRACSSASR
jgi:hypothetical protein